MMLVYELRAKNPARLVGPKDGFNTETKVEKFVRTLQQLDIQAGKNTRAYVVVNCLFPDSLPRYLAVTNLKPLCYKYFAESFHTGRQKSFEFPVTERKRGKKS